eukprot:jgi/Chrzof1/9871/Cz04g19050.t1
MSAKMASATKVNAPRATMNWKAALLKEPQPVAAEIAASEAGVPAAGSTKGSHELEGCAALKEPQPVAAEIAALEAGPPASKVTSVTKVAPIAAVEEEEEEEVLPRAVTQPSPALTPPSPPTTPHYSPITPHYPTITHHYPTITHPSPLPKACQPTKVWLGWHKEVKTALEAWARLLAAHADKVLRHISSLSLSPLPPITVQPHPLHGPCGWHHYNPTPHLVVQPGEWEEMEGVVQGEGTPGAEEAEQAAAIVGAGEAAAGVGAGGEVAAGATDDDAGASETAPCQDDTRAQLGDQATAGVLIAADDDAGASETAPCQDDIRAQLHEDNQPDCTSVAAGAIADQQQCGVEAVMELDGPHDGVLAAGKDDEHHFADTVMAANEMDLADYDHGADGSMAAESADGLLADECGNGVMANGADDVMADGDAGDVVSDDDVTVCQVVISMPSAATMKPSASTTTSRSKKVLKGIKAAVGKIWTHSKEASREMFSKLSFVHRQRLSATAKAATASGDGADKRAAAFTASYGCFGFA